jgi:molybdopterin synthase sulfur carrier subunit
VNVHVRYFAAAREAAGRSAESVDLAGDGTVAALLAHLCERHPALRERAPSLRFAVDEAFVGLDARLRDDAVVALIPPVGGG